MTTTLSREHWIQHINFAAETNAALSHAVAAGWRDRHTHRRRAPQYHLRSISRGKGNKNDKYQLWKKRLTNNIGLFMDEHTEVFEYLINVHNITLQTTDFISKHTQQVDASIRMQVSQIHNAEGHMFTVSE